MDQERALVVTTDFFTPVVDDPYDYGAIAAANSLSDIYAMGGKPFLALNVAAIPPSLPINISSEILRGGAEKCIEAGVVLAGGHTIQDQEPKYGLIVLGFVDPEKMITKSGAKPGDALVITKPLGFGTLTTAIKMAKAKPEEIIEVVKWMKFLNKEASEIAVECGVHGGTDVTGFSLLGHGLELANTSKVGLRFYFHKIPFLNGAKESANDYVFPGGTADNRLYFGLQTTFSACIDEPSQMLLFDAQTSGGLLLAVPQEKISAFLKKAQERDQKMWVIGEVIDGQGIQVLE